MRCRIAANGNRPKENHGERIAVTFDDDSKAYTALTALGELGQQHRVELGSAAIVMRSQDGRIETKEQIADSEYEGTAVGGFMGLLLGVIGGPLGILIGGATGVMVGSLFDLDEERRDRFCPQRCFTLGLDRTPEVVDTAMAEHGGTVLRRQYADVTAEIAAAEEAQRQAKREARKRLMEERKAENKANVQAKIDGLKANMHGARTSLRLVRPLAEGSSQRRWGCRSR